MVRTAMFHAPTGCSAYRTTYRREFHGDAPSRGRHRLRGRWEYSNRNGPNDPNGPSAPSNRSNGKISDPRNLINGSDYSSEASSFIPSSIRDLSRNEKLSLIVLRWLPSG